MAHSHFDQFLQQATYQDPESDTTLEGDAFYGLYTSWCFLTQNSPRAEDIFWDEMAQRTGPRDKLRMTGPAAADYFLNSHQAVV